MTEKDKAKLASTEKRKAADQETEPIKDLKKVSTFYCCCDCYFYYPFCAFLRFFAII